jgi:hypothetical protein
MEGEIKKKWFELGAASRDAVWRKRWDGMRLFIHEKLKNPKSKQATSYSSRRRESLESVLKRMTELEAE